MKNNIFKSINMTKVRDINWFDRKFILPLLKRRKVSDENVWLVFARTPFGTTYILDSGLIS